MVKFADVTENAGSERLDYGRHLVEISEIKDTTKDGDELLDSNGVVMWNVCFSNDDGKHYEYFRFSGGMAHKTGYMFRAIGLLEEDEKITECKKDFKKEDAKGKYLWITIVENKSTTNEKYRKQIAFDGFEKYDSKSKSKPKKEEEEELENFPF